MNYEKIYNQIIDRAKTRKLTGYTENHHIIPKCMGGSDDSHNIVTLTFKEHFMCHKLLCEIYPNENCLVFAYWLMCKAKSKGQYRDVKLSAREYSKLKEEYSRVLKERKPWNFGLTKSDERVAKYAKAKRWNAGLKKGDSKIMDEMHRKSAISRKGKKRPNHSIKMKNIINSKKIKCTKCGKEGSGPGMYYWHFDKCKFF